MKHLFETDLLKDVPQERKEAFLSECRPKTFDQATEILWQGVPTDTFYVVESGQIEVSYIDVNGNSFILHIGEPGEVMGEAEALSGKPCAATCRALPGAVVLSGTRQLLLRHIPAELLIGNLASLLFERMIRENRLRSISESMSADERVDYYLHRFTSPDRPKLFVSQAHLAALAGCTRQTVNLRLNRLRQNGVVDFSRGQIHVLDRDRLGAGLSFT